MTLKYPGTDNLEVMAEATRYNGFLFDLIRQSSALGDRILDFGAGVGTFSIALRDGGFNVECVEPATLQAEMIAAQGLRVYSDLALVPDAAFDLIYTFNVLEHIEDDLAILELLRKKLRAGARLLVYVPAYEILFSAMDRKVGHVRRYRRQALREKVSAAGFVDIHDQYVDSFGFFAALLYKWLGRNDGNINKRALIFYDRWLFPVSRLADRLFSRLFGKNILLRARAPELPINQRQFGTHRRHCDVPSS